MKLFAALFTTVMPNGKRIRSHFEPVAGTSHADALFRLSHMVCENGATFEDVAFTEIGSGDADAARAAKIDGGDEPEHLSLGCASLSHLPGANEPHTTLGQGDYERHLCT